MVAWLQSVTPKKNVVYRDISYQGENSAIDSVMLINSLAN